MITRSTVFGATTLVAASAAAVFWQQLHAERVRSAELQDRVTQLEQRALSAPATLPQVAAGTAPAEPAPASAAPALPAQPVPPPPPPNTALVSSLVQNLTNDPDFCIAQKASVRAQLPQAYPDAAKVLGLTPAQGNALTELLLKQQEGALEGICGGDDARRQPQLSGAARAQAQQAEIEALLGPAKTREWQEYLPTREGRQRVISLRNTLSNGDTPITDAQSGPLLNSVLAEGKRRRDELAARPAPNDPRAMLDYEEESIRILDESQKRLVATTQSFLSPQQIAVMKNSMTQQVAMQRAVLRARRAQMEAGGSNAQRIMVIPRPQ